MAAAMHTTTSTVPVATAFEITESAVPQMVEATATAEGAPWVEPTTAQPMAPQMAPAPPPEAMAQVVVATAEAAPVAVQAEQPAEAFVSGTSSAFTAV